MPSDLAQHVYSRSEHRACVYAAGDLAPRLPTAKVVRPRNSAEVITTGDNPRKDVSSEKQADGDRLAERLDIKEELPQPLRAGSMSNPLFVG
jgi:hypothetical protein